MPELRTICDKSGVSILALKIEVRADTDTAMVELSLAVSLAKLMAALDAFRGHPHVNLIRAALNQP